MPSGGGCGCWAPGRRVSCIPSSGGTRTLGRVPLTGSERLGLGQEARDGGQGL